MSVYLSWGSSIKKNEKKAGSNGDGSKAKQNARILIPSGLVNKCWQPSCGWGIQLAVELNKSCKNRTTGPGAYLGPGLML